jgi:hypothetical protein
MGGTAFVFKAGLSAKTGSQNCEIIFRGLFDLLNGSRFLTVEKYGAGSMLGIWLAGRFRAKKEIRIFY